MNGTAGDRATRCMRPAAAGWSSRGRGLVIRAKPVCLVRFKRSTQSAESLPMRAGISNLMHKKMLKGNTTLRQEGLAGSGTTGGISTHINTEIVIWPLPDIFLFCWKGSGRMGAWAHGRMGAWAKDEWEHGGLGETTPEEWRPGQRSENRSVGVRECGKRLFLSPSHSPALPKRFPHAVGGKAQERRGSGAQVLPRPHNPEYPLRTLVPHSILGRCKESGLRNPLFCYMAD